MYVPILNQESAIQWFSLPHKTIFKRFHITMIVLHQLFYAVKVWVTPFTVLFTVMMYLCLRWPTYYNRNPVLFPQTQLIQRIWETRRVPYLKQELFTLAGHLQPPTPFMAFSLGQWYFLSSTWFVFVPHFFFINEGFKNGHRFVLNCWNIKQDITIMFNEDTSRIKKNFNWNLHHSNASFLFIDNIHVMLRRWGFVSWLVVKFL